MTQRPAVVFGLLWAGLALARSLGRSGVPVTGVAYEPTDFGVRSRHLTRRIVATTDRDELLLAALREAAHDGRPVLFPERDESIGVVLRHWDEVRELADLPLPDDPQVVHNLRRKDLLRAEAERANVLLPATITPDSEEAIRSSGLRPPYLIKPVTGTGVRVPVRREALRRRRPRRGRGRVAPRERPRLRDGRAGADPRLAGEDLLALHVHRARRRGARERRRPQAAPGPAPLRHERRVPRRVRRARARARAAPASRRRLPRLRAGRVRARRARRHVPRCSR